MLLLLTNLAFALERACAPVPLTELESHIEDAETVLAKLDVSSARPMLDAAAEAARCLDQPIPQPLLGRLAWARAEVSGIEMDEEVAWTWIRLAEIAGVPQPPDRIPKNHPVRRVFEDTHDPVPMGGPEGVAVYTPRKGKLYADGAVLTEPVLQVSTPHLLQMFDKDGAPYLGSWQNGAVFPSTMLVPLVSAGNRQRRTAEAGDELPPENWKPRRENTVLAYETWIKKHPKGPWLEDARDGIDDLAWARFDKDGSEVAMKQYIHDFPSGLHVDEARFRIEDMKYREVLLKPDRDAWLKFIKLYPDGIYAREAKVQIEVMDWEDARRADTSEAYTKYLELHPEGRNADLAREREETRAIDEALNTNLERKFRAYLERWPDGRYADVAKAVLGGIEFESIELDFRGRASDSVIESIRQHLMTEMKERALPVESKAGKDGVGKLSLDLDVSPDRHVVRLKAVVRLDYGQMERPLSTFTIDSQMMPGADAGEVLGPMIVANLPSFERWRPAGSVPASKRAEKEERAGTTTILK